MTTIELFLILALCIYAFGAIVMVGVTLWTVTQDDWGFDFGAILRLGLLWPVVGLFIVFEDLSAFKRDQ